MAKKQKTKKAIIIGLGGQGRGWARSIEKHPGWELIGVVDTDTEMLSNAEKLGVGIDEDQAYISIEDAVQYGEKPDLAIIATPINTHHGLVREVMDSGINVICEKNMADSLIKGKQMVQYAIDHPELCTAMGTQYRYGVPRWTAKCFFEEMVGTNKQMGDLTYLDWADYSYRGEKRWGWRRFLNEIYLEDMSVHWFDCCRYVTGMEFTQVQASSFILRGSEWYGSTTVVVNAGLAKPENFHDRHKWAWFHFAGDWGLCAPSNQRFNFYYTKGSSKMSEWGMETLQETDPRKPRVFEEDGYLPVKDVERMGTNYTDQLVILEQMSRGIDSGGAKQRGTNFKEGFKSFAVSQAAIESSFTGKAVWVPDSWKHLLD